MRTSLGLAWLLALVSSCSSVTQESVSARKLTYENREFKRASANCGQDSVCAVFAVTFPVFNGMDTAVAEKVQREIELSFSMGDPEASTKSMEQVANEFIASYEEFSKEIPESGLGWYYKGNVRVNVLEDTLLSIIIDEDYFTGGAHGGMGTYFININPSTGEKVTLADVLRPGYEEDLRSVGESVFREQRQLADTASYQFNNYEFPNGAFALNDNYGFSNDGIIFFFNNYEIAPYAAGPTEVFIPYDRIRKWLRNPIGDQKNL